MGNVVNTPGGLAWKKPKKKKITDRERVLIARAVTRGSSSMWDFRRRDPKHVKTAIRIRGLG